MTFRFISHLPIRLESPLAWTLLFRLAELFSTESNQLLFASKQQHTRPMVQSKWPTTAEEYSIPSTGLGAHGWCGILCNQPYQPRDATSPPE